MAKRTHQVVVPKYAPGTATAVFPAGQHVTSGGVIGQFNPPIGSGPIMFPEGMRRTAGNKWTVYGWNNASFIGSRLTSAAYCAPGVAPTVVEKTVSLPGLGVVSAIATCPAGTVVVGGGYNSGASSKHVEIIVRLNLLSANDWVVTMANLRSAATKLTATVRVNCPTGTSVVFGGVVSNSPGVSAKKTAVVVPFGLSAASATQWAVTGWNVGNMTGSLSAVAYCR